MGQIYKKSFGQLTQCKRLSDGEPYTDWRTRYMYRPGLIIIGKSEKKHPGKSFVYIFPYGQSSLQDYMHTACGDIEISDAGCEIRTLDGIYRFEFGDFGLDDKSQMELLLNVFVNDGSIFS